jgi:hypothetical protein
MTRDLALATFAAVIALGMTAGASAQDMKRCDQLAAYYDRYGGRVSEGRMPTHRLERELGYQKCRSGDFAGGVKLLEEAIRKSGYNVPAG